MELIKISIIFLKFNFPLDALNFRPFEWDRARLQLGSCKQMIFYFMGRHCNSQSLLTAVFSSIKQAHTRPAQSRGICILLILKLTRSIVCEAVLWAVSISFIFKWFIFVHVFVCWIVSGHVCVCRCLLDTLIGLCIPWTCRHFQSPDVCARN